MSFTTPGRIRVPDFKSGFSATSINCSASKVNVTSVTIRFRKINKRVTATLAWNNSVL